LSATHDEISIVTEPRAASQSLAVTAVTHRENKVGDDLSALLILLALRRYQNETPRNNARL
jgi:hypothetical protein